MVNCFQVAFAHLRAEWSITAKFPGVNAMDKGGRESQLIIPGTALRGLETLISPCLWAVSLFRAKHVVNP